ncbi:olfactory receptor 1002-like [Varanus komodoensis]|uniref:olfactory receptor 1002-like n=1 Tax=Varanus komodoensis TaxID=61221 RepID=UPI001CF79DDA|nr:olfactory receptor 1002-like [Varanus komodoensis]
MSEENCTTVVTEFVFVGLTSNPRLQIIFFLVLLAIYMATLVENLGMIALIRASPRLHTPMYFFLGGLSFLDVCFSSVFTPKALANLLADKKSISVMGCAFQMYCSIALGSAECLLLAAMAYDRYVAVCKPLLYPVLMSPRVCILLVWGSYTLGLLHSVVQTVFTFRISYCKTNVINHFFCDITAVLAISSSDIYVNELLMFYEAGLIELFTILSVVVSYVYILTNIVLKIHSAAGRLKGFSTCTSHLTVGTIFHGAILILHLQPTAGNEPAFEHVSDKALAVFYTIVIPVLNPLIYTLRNKEVKDAFLQVFLKQFCVLPVAAFLFLGSRDNKRTHGES